MMQSIPPNPTHSRISASFRDPSGFLFVRDGQLYRQINLVYRENYDKLMSSGLYHVLTRQGMLIPHVEVDAPPALSSQSYKIIQPERVPFISYPYEWTFSQIKDAALLTLKIQREALDAGMSLKDASAYNIQFYRGSPVLIDTLSFEVYQEDQPWIAYRQFCQHFLAPLALMSLRDVRLSKLLWSFIDGIPLDLASRLLPRKSWFDFGLLSHLHLHAKAQQRYAGKEVDLTKRRAVMSRLAMIGLIDSLERTIRRLNWHPAGTEWAEYYDLTNYSANSFEFKKKIVSDLIHRLKPRLIWDLGANTGVFSRLGADLEDCLVIASDIDPAAVEMNYLECKRTKMSNILPLILDVTNPSPAIGWQNMERLSFLQRGPADLILVLALIHHLAISNNLPLGHISHFLAQTGRYLIIEFVPKEDSQVRKMLASRQDIFPDYTLTGFLQVFSQNFVLREQIPIEGTDRTICFFEKK